MPYFEHPEIVCMDRAKDGLIVKFSDGRAGWYSASLLYVLLHLAKDLDLSSDDDREGEDLRIM